MLKMNLETNINNLNYLRYMEHKDKENGENKGHFEREQTTSADKKEKNNFLS